MPDTPSSQNTIGKVMRREWRKVPKPLLAVGVAGWLSILWPLAFAAAVCLSVVALLIAYSFSNTASDRRQEEDAILSQAEAIKARRSANAR